MQMVTLWKYINSTCILFSPIFNDRIECLLFFLEHIFVLFVYSFMTITIYNLSSDGNIIITTGTNSGARTD